MGSNSPKKQISWQIIGFIVLIVFLFCLPGIVRDQYYLHAMTTILLFAYLASAWNIVGGFAGQLSLGHAAFVGLGAYTSSLLFLRWGISPWLGMFPGALMAVIGAILIGYPCFRLRGPYYALSTLAFTWILLDIVLGTERFAGFDIRGAMGVRSSFWGIRRPIFNLLIIGIFTTSFSPCCLLPSGFPTSLHAPNWALI